MESLLPPRPVWYLEIPDYRPPLVNDLLRMHWARRSDAKLEYANLMGIYSREIPKIDPLHMPIRRVAIIVSGWKRGRLPDPDAVLKCTLDAMKSAYLIVDDSQQWCSWERPKIIRSEVSLVQIRIEDMV